MNRLLLPLGGALLVGVLAACQNPASVAHERWVGTSTFDATSHPVVLEFSRLSDELAGTYVVGAARGAFAATLDGEALTGELRPSGVCTYDLSGTMTSSSLEATFAPSDCPDGQAGSWSLEKE